MHGMPSLFQSTILLFMQTANGQNHLRTFFADKLFSEVEKWLATGRAFQSRTSTSFPAKPKRLRSNFNQLLTLVLPELPLSLLGRSERKALKDFGKRLPLAGRGGFDMDLLETESNGSLAMMISEEEAARFARLDLRRIKSPVWQSIPEFCKWWVGHGLDVQHIRLEMEAAGLTTKPPKADVFVGFSESPSAQRMTEVLGFFSSQLETPDALEGFLKSLPRSTKVFQAGRILSQNLEGLRISVHGFGHKSLNTFLKAQGLSSLDHLPASIAAQSDIAAVHFDITNEISPTITLDLQPMPTQNWRMLFKELVEQDLCTAERKNLALDFQGSREAGAMNALWKQVGAASPKELGNTGNHVEWGLGLLKLTVGPIAQLHAKACLHFGRGRHNAYRTAASLNAR